jgi:bifunctional non-homologous end joining protein LigD
VDPLSRITEHDQHVTRPLPVPVRPMLAVAGSPPEPPHGWSFEFKWDGVRAIIATAGTRLRATSRNGNDITAGYPELPAAQLGAEHALLLDAELVALDQAGRPDFGLLQQRMHVRPPSPQLRARVPVRLYLFDLLEIDGASLLREPYDTRRARLLDLGLDAQPSVSVPPAFTDITGTQLLDIARTHGLEGIVAKRRSSRYEPGRRSPAWIKTALLTTLEVLLCGWTPGRGSRATSLGSLLLGAYDHTGALRFLGHVGGGFTETMLHTLLSKLQPLERPDSPFDEQVPREYARRAHWVHPELVAEVTYRAMTHDGRLRAAVWRGLLPDRDPSEVELPLPR